jgi:TolB-like protein
MKTRFFLIVVVSMSFICSLLAQEKIAVLPVSGNADEGTRGMLMEAISDGLSNSGYRLIERAQLDKVMQELKWQVDGAVDETNGAEVGKQAGANYVCLSSCNKSGNDYMISYRLVDVTTGDVLMRERKTTTGGLLIQTINEIASSKLFAMSANNLSSLCGFEIAKEDLRGSSTAVPQGWRLPTVSELQCMCEHKKEIGGFNAGEYLSSETKNGFRQGVKFNTCTQTAIIDQASVRCIKR